MRTFVLASLRRNALPYIPRSTRQFSVAPWLASQSEARGLPFPLQQDQFAQLKETLMQREMPVLYEIPTGTPSALLETTLRDFLPREFQPVAGLSEKDVAEYRRHGRPGEKLPRIPFSYHLIYFPPQTSLSQLLPDSTDPAQSPGDPFDRRMWAGGSIEMRPAKIDQSDRWAMPSVWRLGRLARSVCDEVSACVEHISDVQLKGTGDTQKIFVTLERRIGAVGLVDNPQSSIAHRSLHHVTRESEIRAQLMNDDRCSVIEKRNLVFMNNSRMPKPEPKSENKPASPPKVVKAPHPPDYSVTLVPNANLLFRFSALTYNAHRIHLDKEYCRSIEGHRDLIVHGPLSVVLMSEVLRGYLDREYPQLTKPTLIDMKNALLETENDAAPELITSLVYRNLAPIYAEEEIRVCMRKKDTTETGAIYELWVENANGSMCVRGTATTVRLDLASAKQKYQVDAQNASEDAVVSQWPVLQMRTDSSE